MAIERRLGFIIRRVAGPAILGGITAGALTACLTTEKSSQPQPTPVEQEPQSLMSLILQLSAAGI